MSHETEIESVRVIDRDVDVDTILQRLGYTLKLPSGPYRLVVEFDARVVGLALRGAQLVRLTFEPGNVHNDARLAVEREATRGRG